MFADRQFFKIFLTTVCFFAVTFYCAGQSDSTHKKKYNLGIGIGTSVSPATHGLNYSADMTVEKGKSFFAAGLIIGPRIRICPYITIGGYEETSPGQNRINGFHTLYQFNPNPKGKRFDFFFQYEFIYLLYQDQGNYFNYYPAYVIGTTLYPSQLKLVNYQSNYLYLENYIGYGFKVKFLKHFSLTQCFGIGHLYYLSKFNNDILYGPTHSFSGNVKVTLNYYFGRK